MRRKSSNFLELYADKFILGIFAIVSIWLLVFQVLSSSSSVEYDSRSFEPGRIDRYIETQARELEEKLGMEPDGKREYKSKLDTYRSLLSSAINGVDSSLFLPMPNYGSKVVHGERAYQIPPIGPVSDVAAYLVRGVAYNPLQKSETDSVELEDELLDVDLVTVQGSFDAGELFARFFENFAGDKLPEQWRDGKLARPIFAAVRLERQQMAKDGGWPDEWQKMARLKIDSMRDVFKIPEDASKLQLGVEVLMVQFDRPEVKVGLLQPEVYDFALPTESWLPPLLFQQRQERMEKLRQEEERRLREEEKRRRLEDRERAGGGRRRERQPRDMGMGGGGMGGGPMGGGPVGGARDRRTATRRTPRRESERPRRTPAERDLEGSRSEETVKDELVQYEEIRVTEITNFEEVHRPLVFWAHDETAESGFTYRYRISIGVFNPIAGTEWFGDESQQLKDQIILWSDSSTVTESITVPKKLYFFPMQVRESDKTLTVDVRKYSLGKWYGKNFKVKPGESIGQLVKQRRTDEFEDVGPSSIDYQTGTTFLDIVDVSDWFGPTTLRRREYSDVLYTQDGVNIEHLPVQARYWPSELRKKLDDIDKKQAEQEEGSLVLRGRRTPGQQRTPRRGPGVPGAPGGGAPGQFMPGKPF